MLKNRERGLHVSSKDEKQNPDRDRRNRDYYKKEKYKDKDRERRDEDRKRGKKIIDFILYISSRTTNG